MHNARNVSELADLQDLSHDSEHFQRDTRQQYVCSCCATAKLVSNNVRAGIGVRNVIA